MKYCYILFFISFIVPFIIFLKKEIHLPLEELKKRATEYWGIFLLFAVLIWILSYAFFGELI